MRRTQRRLQDESGMSLVFVGMGLMAFLSASILAVDVGMLMTARNQAQNSADAGALAGAALALRRLQRLLRERSGGDERDHDGKANQVMRADVSLTVADVQFLRIRPASRTGVKLDVYRRQSRGNPLSTMHRAVLRQPRRDIGATRRRKLRPRTPRRARCRLRFRIAGREMQTRRGTRSTTISTRSRTRASRWPLPDIYVGPNDKTNYTGYNAVRDKGMRVVLKADNGSKLAPSMYQVWDTVGGNRGPTTSDLASAGASRATLMGYGDTFVHKPGMQSGPVAQGIEDLVASDPDAYWDMARTRSFPP